LTFGINSFSSFTSLSQKQFTYLAGNNIKSPEDNPLRVPMTIRKTCWFGQF